MTDTPPEVIPDNVRHLPWNPSEQLPPRDERDWITSVELVQETGISYRQLDYWCRTGLLTCLSVPTARQRFGDLPITDTNPGSGYPRRFSEHERDRARVIKDLLHAGLSLQTIRQVVDQVTEHHSVRLGTVTITHRVPGEAS